MAVDKRLAAGVPLTAALLGWLQVPQSLPEELANPPPRYTEVTQDGWGGVPWTPVVSFNAQQRLAFERDGFTVLRNFFSPGLVTKLRLAHDRWCPRGLYSPHWNCKNEDVWARSDIYRDFLYWSPLGKSIGSLLNVRGVRIYGDHVTEMRAKNRGIFYHFDNIYYGGVLGEFHAKSKGAIAFVFLSPVNKTTTGGSVLVEPGGHRHNCVAAGVDPRLQEPCRQQFYERAIALHFNPGDVLVIHPLMPHASQEPLEAAPPQLRRITYLARFVEADAVFCGTDTQVRHTGKVDCRHPLRRGDLAHHVCFHQISPLVAGEVADRMSADWYTSRCNVFRGWQYTGPTRLKFRLLGALSHLRFLLKGGSPVDQERAECIY